jgi:hypothetical protein
MQDQGRLAMPLLSPHIDRLSWGNMQVSGLGEGKDFKLWPGGGRAWNWIETETHHVPGILPSDVEELLEHGAEVVVLSRGMLLRLQIARETVALPLQRTRRAGFRGRWAVPFDLLTCDLDQPISKTAIVGTASIGRVSGLICPGPGYLGGVD